MRRTRLIAQLLCVATLLAAVSAAFAQDNPSPTTEVKTNYLMECRVTQVRASISGSTSLTDDIGIRDEQGQLTAVSGPFTFYTLADLKIGDIDFRFDGDGEQWDGQARPTDLSHANVLAAPRILVLSGQAAEILIGGVEQFEYMRRVEGNRFELVTVDLPVGITIKLTAVPDKDGRVRLNPLEIGVASVQGREPIEGVNLNVGKPILTKDFARHELTFEVGRPYGIQWRTRDQGVLLITLKVAEVLERPKTP